MATKRLPKFQVAILFKYTDGINIDYTLLEEFPNIAKLILSEDREAVNNLRATPSYFLPNVLAAVK